MAAEFNLDDIVSEATQGQDTSVSESATVSSGQAAKASSKSGK
jgi:hypothetical protein